MLALWKSLQEIVNSVEIFDDTHDPNPLGSHVSNFGGKSRCRHDMSQYYAFLGIS